jgi:protein-L-isoaspartate(D-aspartate) O-methyltransferase
MSQWEASAAALAEQLAAAGCLLPAWRDAMERTPRHVFLPGHPLARAYEDDAVVVQQRPAPIIGTGNEMTLPTSSASQPSVVALMLGHLNGDPGMRVLEIGTGTGYNAALLCHRLGDKNVASIDIDADLVDQARAVLASLGHHPVLAAGDGYHGLPEAAPYDAILATCAITHIPPRWIGQLSDRGRIVAPMYGPGQALMVATKTAPDEVVGHFHPLPASFMPLRDRVDDPLAPGQVLGFEGPRIAHEGNTDVDPQAVTAAGPDLLFFLHLHLPGLHVGTADRDHGSVATVTANGSYAEVDLDPASPGRWVTRQRGRRRLWDTVEHAMARWHRLSRPSRQRFGLTALDDTDRQYVWLDDPDGPHCWPCAGGST